MGRFGTPDGLTGALPWLLSPASRFVAGVIVRVASARVGQGWQVPDGTGRP